MIYQNMIHRFKQEHNKYIAWLILNEKIVESQEQIKKRLYTPEKANEIFNLSNSDAKVKWNDFKILFTELKSKMWEIEKIFKPTTKQ